MISRLNVNDPCSELKKKKKKKKKLQVISHSILGEPYQKVKQVGFFKRNQMKGPMVAYFCHEIAR